MSTTTITHLKGAVEATIATMPSTFTAHEFILKLAQANQTIYIEALYEYKDTLRSGSTAPFMMMHGIIAQMLHDFPHLVKKTGDVASKDIFGNDNACSAWKK